MNIKLIRSLFLSLLVLGSLMPSVVLAQNLNCNPAEADIPDMVSDHGYEVYTISGYPEAEFITACSQGDYDRIISIYENSDIVDYDPPNVTPAATPTNFQELVNLIINTIFQPLTLLILAGAVVMFLWGLVQYINRGSEGSKEAVSLMFWGIVILFVMVSVWGLVSVLTGTFSFSNTPITPPTAEFDPT